MKDDPKQSVWKIRVFDGSEIEPEDNYYVTLSDEKQNTSESSDDESKSDQSKARSARAAERR